MPSRDPAREPSIKGAVIREMLIWYEGRFGHEAVVALAGQVPPQPGALLDPSQPALGVLSSNWYPMSVTHPLMDAVSEGTPDEGREIAKEANAFVVPRMIRGVYKILFSVAATPERYARNVPRLWRGLHTTGERKITIREPGEALSVTEDWTGHHTLLCWTTIYTMAFVFEAMGFKRWEVERTACVALGSSRCESVLRYER